jgi:hypothetical protein
VRGRVLEPLAGRTQLPMGARNRHHSVATAHEILEFDLKALPVLADSMKEAADGVPASEVATMRQALWRVPFDVRIDRRENGGDIASCERDVQAADYIVV